MADVFQSAVSELNVSAAMRGGSEPNDLLPPRLEDKAIGEVGKRFSEGLVTRLERGRYDPTPAEFVSVPKPGHTTRPAALLTLSDRVLYEALVDSLRARIDAAMVGDGAAYWPRGRAGDKQWEKFEAGCLGSRPNFVALADITAFYENVDHDILRDVLIDLTGRKIIVDALAEFLTRVMRSRRGVPQGLSASDPLASAYLTPLDHAMGRGGFDYHRHGDDIRIGCQSFADAKRALQELERELRRRGLLLSGSKAFITSAESYRNTLDQGKRFEDETRRALLEARIQELRGNDEKIAELLDRSGRRDLGWLFFYHNSLSFEEMVQQVGPQLSPSDVDIAANVFTDAMKRNPEAQDHLPREVFHQRITSSLVRLAAAKSPVAIPSINELIQIGPERTGVIANYLGAVSGRDGHGVANAALRALEDDTFKTAWAKTWLLMTLRRVSSHLSEHGLKVVSQIAHDESESTIARVEAMKALATRGVCDRDLLRRLWNFAPSVYQSDLVAVAYYARKSQDWCSAFLDGVKDDPVHIVVLRHLEMEDQA